MNLIVNSTANDPLSLSRYSQSLGCLLHPSCREDMATAHLEDLEARLDSRLQQEDVQGIRRMARLAVKYMGKQNGFQVSSTKVEA